MVEYLLLHVIKLRITAAQYYRVLWLNGFIPSVCVCVGGVFIPQPCIVH